MYPWYIESIPDAAAVAPAVAIVPIAATARAFEAAPLSEHGRETSAILAASKTLSLLVIPETATAIITCWEGYSSFDTLYKEI